MKFFDTHCHLGGEELKDKAVSLVESALGQDVLGFGLIAADETSLRQVESLRSQLLQKFPTAKIVSTSGIHPHDAKNLSDDLWNEVCTLARGPASAIGETGLDYHYNLSSHEIQIEWFQRHIDLACETKKPLVIHCREARDDVLRMLDQENLKAHPNPGILHCFTEDLDTAKRLLDLNFYISFSGIMSFKNAQNLRDIAAYVPADRILIETDSPYLAPVPHRGKTNEPLFVKDVFTVLANVRGAQDAKSMLELSETLWRNSCRVFSLS